MGTKAELSISPTLLHASPVHAVCKEQQFHLFTDFKILLWNVPLIPLLGLHFPTFPFTELVVGST